MRERSRFISILVNETLKLARLRSRVPPEDSTREAARFARRSVYSNRTHAPRQGRLTRSPRRRGRATRGHFKPESLGSLEVDDEFVLGRRLHRQVGRLLTFEDAIDIAGCASILVDNIRPIGIRPPPATNIASVVYRRQLVPRPAKRADRDETPPTRSPSL